MRFFRREAVPSIPEYTLIRLRGYLEEGPADAGEEAIAGSLLRKLERGSLDLTGDEQELFNYLTDLGPMG